MSRRSWDDDQLRKAVETSHSYRSVIKKIGLIPAGGNYSLIQRVVKELDISTTHFTGKLWNKGMKGIGKPRFELTDILRKDSNFQSYKLKRRLFAAGLKPKYCEQCGWAETTPDGYLPLELDHINGDSRDNRLKNLRILCPNCHSLQPTHRGRNKKHARVVKW